MTPNEKTKFKDQAQTRALSVFSSGHETKRIDTDNYVEGYAARYEPYVLFYDRDENGNELPVYERFERGCFASADMSDIIMQYDHEGKVLARTSNGSLIVEADDTGLFFAADLSRTDAARSLFDDVKAGMMLSEAFDKHKKSFPNFFRSMVHVGEISGKLDEVFRSLADYYERDTALKGKVKSVGLSNALGSHAVSGTDTCAAAASCRGGCPGGGTDGGGLQR